MRNRGSIALGFIALILIGAILLAAPFSRVAGTWGTPLTAAFTACSAVCVTGLSVVDIAAEYSRTGQIILLSLVQLGCLGLMTFGTFLMIAVGRRLSLSREFSLMNAYGVAEVRGLRGLICWVIGSMLIIESIGAALLFLRLDDVYLSIYYSVMSFCNAGFSILPHSLATFAADPFITFTLALEVILGGIGFLVIYNLCTFKFIRRASGARARLTLHTRVVLRTTLILLALAFLSFLALEWNHSLHNFSPAQKTWVAFFQSVTPRTCGFTITPSESLQPLTRLIYSCLMFIGGAPGSAAAGIKVTTLAVLIATLLAMCRGQNETIIRQRVVPTDIVRESFVILISLLALTILVLAALLLTETKTGLTLEELFFEAISAITTTGLSISDTTARLSSPGKVVIMLAMFMGRLGALTVVMLIGDREHTSHIRYPSEELVVG